MSKKSKKYDDYGLSWVAWIFIGFIAMIVVGLVIVFSAVFKSESSEKNEILELQPAVIQENEIIAEGATRNSTACDDCVKTYYSVEGFSRFNKYFVITFYPESSIDSSLRELGTPITFGVAEGYLFNYPGTDTWAEVEYDGSVWVIDKEENGVNSQENFEAWKTLIENLEFVESSS